MGASVNVGDDSEQRAGDDAIGEIQEVDWLANVVEVDPTQDHFPRETAMPEVGQQPLADMESGTEHRSRPVRDPSRSTDHRSGGRIRQIGSQTVNRYQQLPSWVLLPQLFLAAGWGRAGVAHALSRRWWTGEEILDFLATETELQVGPYHHVLTWIVEPFPALTAVVVGLTELVIAVLLAANYRVKLALVAAAFLNVQFILAGVVNPSIFYLVASLGIAIWRLETAASPETISRLIRVCLPLGLGASLLLAPSVRTIEPETAIEDPALVLIFLIALSATSLWWANRRTASASDTPTALIGDDRVGSQPRGTPIPMARLAVTAVAAVATLVAGFGVSAEVGARQGEAGPNQAVARSESSELGSLGRPYAFGQDVTLSYNDLETGTLRQWQVQVMDALLLNGDRLGLASPTADSRLAMARIQLRYPVWEGRTADLTFNALDQSGHSIPAIREGCGERAPLPPQGFESTTGAIEGWVCWWVSATDLRSLLLAVEAEPADGIVYMSLGRD